jgi:hypothetical protein
MIIHIDGVSRLKRDPRFRGDPQSQDEFLLEVRKNGELCDLYYFNRLDPLVQELGLSMSDLDNADPIDHAGC